MISCNIPFAFRTDLYYINNTYGEMLVRYTLQIEFIFLIFLLF